MAFLGARTTNLLKAKNFSSKNEKKEKRGKTLSYERESKGIRGLDISPREAWSKWEKFTAGRPITGKGIAVTPRHLVMYQYQGDG